MYIQVTRVCRQDTGTVIAGKGNLSQEGLQSRKDGAGAGLDIEPLCSCWKQTSPGMLYKGGKQRRSDGSQSPTRCIKETRNQQTVSVVLVSLDRQYSQGLFLFCSVFLHRPALLSFFLSLLCLSLYLVHSFFLSNFFLLSFYFHT